MCCPDALAAAARLPSTPERMDRASLERDVNEYIERTVTRADELAPARAALVAADDARTAGNASFRSGDFATALETYEKGERALRTDALREPVTMAAAERALLALLANSAQCALKLGEHARAANLATAALGIHVCASEPALFKKVMVRLALARDASGDADAAVATCEEAQLRGLTAPDFDAIMRKAGRTSVGALGDGHEPRMFVMLGLRLSDGAENLARIRGVVESGSLPHVDRRDEAGNNILWGTLHALHGAVEPSGKGEAGDTAGAAGAAGEGCVPTLAYLYAAGADPCQRYDGGKTPLMYAAGSGHVAAVRATLDAMRARRRAINAEARRDGGDAWTRSVERLMEHPEDPESIRDWVDVADDGGWTPLMVALMMKDDAPKENVGAKPMGEREQLAVLAIVRELLDAGANPLARNVDGNCPLHLAAMSGASEPAVELLRRCSDPAALLSLRNTHGMSAAMVARRVAPNSGVVADLIAAADRCGGDARAELEEDLRVCKWEAAVGAVGAANNAAIERIVDFEGEELLATPWAEQECVFAKCDAWLSMCGFDDLPNVPKGEDESANKPLSVRAFDAYGDVYAAVRAKICDELLPRCVSRRMDVRDPGSTPSVADCARLWYVSGGERRKEDVASSPPARFVPHLGGVVANPRCVAFDELVARVLPHSFAFAVPCDDALSAVASLNRPVVEMGAGTGYWTALLRQKGVDVVAYDAHPPRRITKAFAKGEAKFFGVTYVDDVRECDDDASCLDAHADRVLMLCWPKSPEDVEGGDWDLRCLDRWRGDTLVHVGEWSVNLDEDVDDDGIRSLDLEYTGAPRVSEEFPRGTTALNLPHGETTSAGFQRRVEREFERVATVRLPNWPFARDDLTVWRRRTG